MRYSKKREKIIETFQRGELMTVLEVAAQNKDMDMVTIYRNINLLVKEGVLKEVKIIKGTSSYELVRDNHQHFICNNCEKIIPFDIDEGMLLSSLKRKGVEIEKLEINVNGLCMSCN